MKKLNLNDIMMQKLSVGGTLKAGCYQGTVTKLEKITKNNKSYVDLSVNVKGTVVTWRLFDVTKFKLEYLLATGEQLKKITNIRDKEITFYAEVNGRYNKFSMLRPLPEVGAYEVVYGGVTCYEQYNAFVIKIMFDDNFTYYDIRYIDSDEALARFANYTMSAIAFQFGYDTEFAIAELEDNAGQTMVANVIKKEQYKTPFINYDVIKVTELIDEEDIEDEIENQIEDDIEEI